MKTVYLACVFVCVLNSGLAAPVDQAGCLFNDNTYADGDFNVACSMRCTCNGTSGNIGCVSMCPPMRPNDGCEMVENPDKDEEHSSNCCPIEECGPPPAPCFEGNVTIPHAHLMIIGDQWCSCLSGNKTCSPLSTP